MEWFVISFKEWDNCVYRNETFQQAEELAKRCYEDGHTEIKILQLHGWIEERTSAVFVANPNTLPF